MSPHARQLSLACIAGTLALAGPAQAVDLSAAVGRAGDGYSSTALNAGFELGKLPLRIDAGYFDGGAGDSNVSQANASLTWKVTDQFSATAGYQRVDDDIFRMTGAELSTTVSLESLWNGTRSTQLTAGYGELKYTPDTDARIAPALLARIPRQSRYSIGLSQGLTEKVSLSLGYEDYGYSKNPVELAASIAIRARRFGLPVNAAYTVSSFADQSANLGLNWAVRDTVSINVGYSSFKTVLDQRSASTTLGLTWSFERFWLNPSVSHNSSERLAGLRGVTIIPSDSGNSVELRIGTSL